jgi:hypothetical protein
MNLREAAEQALDAMEDLHRTGDTQFFDMCVAPTLIPALRAALAQKQEPVAWQAVGGSIWAHKTSEDDRPLYAAPHPAGEPDMRHPKIQALIGGKARREIELRIVEQLLDDPNCELTSMDMEYWHGLHDKLREKLTAASQPAASGEPFGYLWPTGMHPEFRFYQQKRDGVDGMPLYAAPQPAPAPAVSGEPVAWLNSDSMKAMAADEKTAWLEAGRADLVDGYTTPLYTAPKAL